MADFLDEEDDLLVESYKKADDLDDDLDDEALLYDSDGPDDNILDFSPPAMQETAFQFSTSPASLGPPAEAEKTKSDFDNKNGIEQSAVSDKVEDSINLEAKKSPVKRTADSVATEQADVIQTSEDAVTTKRRRFSSEVSLNDHENPSADGEHHGDVSHNLEDGGNVIDDEESDEDDQERDRFRSERDGKTVTKPARSNTTDKRDIPDTLEISKEAQQKIEDFDKQQREKKFNRQNRRRGRGRGNMQGPRMGSSNNNLPQMRLQGAPRPLMSLRTMPFRPVSQAATIPRPLVPNILNPLLRGHAPPPNIPLLPPAEMIKLLGPPPPIVAQALTITPPQIRIPPPPMPIIVSSAAPPPTVAIASVPSTITPAVAAGNPIPTLMTRNQRTESSQNEVSDDKKREVVFDGNSAGRTSPKLSVKISRSRSRSPSPVPRSIHKRTVVKSRRSRSPRSRSRSRRSPRRKSRRHSRSVSPKRRSYSPVRSASPKNSKPAKIHINPHFKGPRTFPVPSSSAPAPTNPSTQTAPPAIINPSVPPPTLTFPPPALPNPSVPPPSLVAPTPAATRPVIPIPPPALPPPPGIDVPPPSLKATLPPPALPVRHPGSRMPIPPPINPSVPPPVIPPAPKVLLPTPVTTNVARPAVKPIGDGLLPTPRASARLVNPRSANGKPPMQPSVPLAKQTVHSQVAPNRQPVALIRPSSVDSNKHKQTSTVKKRLGQKQQEKPSAIETVASSRLKPPPAISKATSAPTQAQKHWEVGSAEDNMRYNALLKEQAEKRKEILARKSRKKGSVVPIENAKPQPTPTVVRISNLAAETKLSSVERLMNSVAPVTDVTYDGANHVISGKFKTRQAAEAFTEKYDRYMLDLSYITAKIV